MSREFWYSGCSVQSSILPELLQLQYIEKPIVHLELFVFIWTSSYGDLMNDRLKSTLKYLGIVLLGLLLSAFLIKTLEMFLHAL
jgi:hypothetical protein